METRYEWAALASGQRAVVEVQKHLVGRSILKRAPGEEGIHDRHEGEAELTRHELRYERSTTDPSYYDIIEIRTREIIRESINGKEGEDDGDYTLLASGDDCASSVSTCNESNDIPKCCKDSKQQLAQKAAEAYRKVPSVYGEGHDEAGSSATLGRGQEVAATMSTSRQSATGKTPDPPGLTAVRLLFQLSSPTYSELLASKMECLWIIRICDEKEGIFGKTAPMESVLETCKQAGVQPKLVRELYYDMSRSKCWLIELHSPQAGQLFAGKQREYISFIDDLLCIWQKIKREDFDKPTEWHIKNLPPHLAQLSGEKLKEKIEALDKGHHFRSLRSVQHDYLSGTCILRGIAEYYSSNPEIFFQYTSFSLHDGFKSGVVISLECAEQCTFCGLDCSMKGDADYHNAQTCPYKTILKRHKAQQDSKNTVK